jgi:hypothetical protein
MGFDCSILSLKCESVDGHVLHSSGIDLVAYLACTSILAVCFAPGAFLGLMNEVFGRCWVLPALSLPWSVLRSLKRCETSWEVTLPLDSMIWLRGLIVFCRFSYRVVTSLLRYCLKLADWNRTDMSMGFCKDSSIVPSDAFNTTGPVALSSGDRLLPIFESLFNPEVPPFKKQALLLA